MPVYLDCRRGKKRGFHLYHYEGQREHCWLGQVDFFVVYRYPPFLSHDSRPRAHLQILSIELACILYSVCRVPLPSVLSRGSSNSIEELFICRFLLFSLVCGFLLCQAQFSGDGCITGSQLLCLLEVFQTLLVVFEANIR